MKRGAGLSGPGMGVSALVPSAFVPGKKMKRSLDSDKAAVQGFVFPIGDAE